MFLIVYLFINGAKGQQICILTRIYKYCKSVDIYSDLYVYAATYQEFSYYISMAESSTAYTVISKDSANKN